MIGALKSRSVKLTSASFHDPSFAKAVAEISVSAQIANAIFHEYSPYWFDRTSLSFERAGDKSR